jgi:hypothetical protein|nr:MAG TPA: hypothetical protein [Caudoviricetes sp.]
MNTGAELITAHIEAENIAAKHLDFIKTNGERGRSAMADLSVFEELESTETNRYLTLRTEYFILRRLVQAMRDELKRMEEKN